MAFGSAAGYGNLPSGNFAPEILAKKFSSSFVALRLLKTSRILTTLAKLKTLAIRFAS